MLELELSPENIQPITALKCPFSIINFCKQLDSWKKYFSRVFYLNFHAKNSESSFSRCVQFRNNVVSALQHVWQWESNRTILLRSYVTLNTQLGENHFLIRVNAAFDWVVNYCKKFETKTLIPPKNSIKFQKYQNGI